MTDEERAKDDARNLFGWCSAFSPNSTGVLVICRLDAANPKRADVKQFNFLQQLVTLGRPLQPRKLLKITVFF